jgi:hypothetical protein
MSEPLEAQDELKLRPLKKNSIRTGRAKARPYISLHGTPHDRIGGALGHLASRSAEIKCGGGLVVPAFVAVGQGPLVDFARLQDGFA